MTYDTDSRTTLIVDSLQNIFTNMSVPYYFIPSKHAVKTELIIPQNVLPFNHSVC